MTISRRNFLSAGGALVLAGGLPAEPYKLPNIAPPGFEPEPLPQDPLSDSARVGFALVGLGNLTVRQLLPAFAPLRLRRQPTAESRVAGCLPNGNVFEGSPATAAIPRAQTLSERHGFLKVVIDAHSDQTIGFAMLGKLPYATLGDTIRSHSTLSEGLNLLFGQGMKA